MRIQRKFTRKNLKILCKLNITKCINRNQLLQINKNNCKYSYNSNNFISNNNKC